MRAIGHRYVLSFHVELEAIVASIASNAATFRPSEWRRQMSDILGIHPHHSNVEVASDADEDTLRRAALASPRVQSHLEGREPKKVIVVPGRLINIVG